MTLLEVFAGVIIIVSFLYINKEFNFIELKSKKADCSRYFEIKKYKDGYDIYRNGMLEAEFTRQNTDSLSLETLKMIYEGDN